MFRKFALLISFCMLFCCMGAYAYTPGNYRQKTIHLIGDSLVCDYSTDTGITGWGTALKSKISFNIAVSNAAFPGGSTKGFLYGSATHNGGYSEKWSAVKNAFGSGDFLFIQFAHNDSKTDNGDRYSTVDEYKANLAEFAETALASGVTPIFVTSPDRLTSYNSASDRFVQDAVLVTYADAMKETAARFGSVVIDLNRLWSEHLNSVGYETAKTYYMSYIDGTDSTHFTAEGAENLAVIIKNELQKSYGSIVSEFAWSAEISFERNWGSRSDLRLPIQWIDKSNTTVYANAYLQGSVENSVLLAALYEHGTLAGIAAEAIEPSMMKATAAVSIPQSTDGLVLKAYIWNDLKGLMPVSGSSTVLTAANKAITSMSVNGVKADIDRGLGEITLDTSAAAAASITLAPGCTVYPSPSQVQDFSKPVYYTVTAADGSTAKYTVNPPAKLKEDFSSYDAVRWEKAPDSNWTSFGGLTDTSANNGSGHFIVSDGSSKYLRLYDLLTEAKSTSTYTVRRKVSQTDGNFIFEARYKYELPEGIDNADGLTGSYALWDTSNAGYYLYSNGTQYAGFYGIGSGHNISAAGTSNAKLFTVNYGTWYKTRMYMRCENGKASSEYYIVGQDPNTNQYIHVASADDTYIAAPSSGISQIRITTRQNGMIDFYTDYIKLY